jgi:hypothetical protein
MAVDLLFFLAVGAIGWGLSLATYRELAHHNGWPLGEAQSVAPITMSIIGLASITPGLILAMARGPLHGGVVIVLFGVALAVFWSGFLRVGAQSALLLAPAAAALLLLASALRALGLWGA